MPDTNLLPGAVAPNPVQPMADPDPITEVADQINQQAAGIRQQAEQPMILPADQTSGGGSAAAVNSSLRSGPVKGSLPTDPTIRSGIEQIARQKGVPVNILMALAQQESGYNPNAIGQPTQYGQAQGMLQYIPSTADSLKINPYDWRQAVSAAADQYKQRLANGDTPIQAVMAHFGGDNRDQWGPKTQQYGRDVMQRARDILGAYRQIKTADDAQAMPDPNAQPLPHPGQTDQPAATPGSDSGSLLVDAGKMAAGGAIKGTGSLISGAGEFLKDNPAELVMNWLIGPPKHDVPDLTPKIAAAVKGFGQSIQDSVSQASKDAAQGSTPDAPSLDPRTWTLGTNPSLRGYMMMGSDIMGEMAPMLASAFLPGGPLVAAGEMGLQGGGQAVEQAHDNIMAMAKDGTLAQHSAYYNTLIKQGMKPDEAAQKTADAAGRWAFLLAAPVNALGAGISAKLVHPATELAASLNRAGRVAVRAGLGSTDMAAQNAAAQAATNEGQNIGAGGDTPVTQGVGGAALTGAMMGAIPAGVGGAFSRRATPGTETPAPNSGAPAGEPTQEAPNSGAPPAAAAGEDQQPPGPAGQPAPALRPTEPARGPLSRSANVATQAENRQSFEQAMASGQTPRVTVAGGLGAPVTGELHNYARRGQGGWAAEIVDDQGEVHRFTDQDGVTIAPAGQAPAASAAPAAPQESTAAPRLQSNPAAITPEPEGDIAAQIAAVRDPNSGKRAALITPGSPLAHLNLSGLTNIRTKQGVFVTNDPELAAEARAHAWTMTDEQMQQLLGYTTPKALTDGTVVQTHDAQGNVVHEEATNQQQLPLAIDRAHRNAPIGGRVVTTDAAAALGRRQASMGEDVIGALTLPQAEARAAYLRDQARTTGWTQPLRRARDAVNERIVELGGQPQTDELSTASDLRVGNDVPASGKDDAEPGVSEQGSGARPETVSPERPRGNEGAGGTGGDDNGAAVSAAAGAGQREAAVAPPEAYITQADADQLIARQKKAEPGSVSIQVTPRGVSAGLRFETGDKTGQFDRKFLAPIKKEPGLGLVPVSKLQEMIDGETSEHADGAAARRGNGTDDSAEPRSPAAADESGSAASPAAAEPERAAAAESARPAEERAADRPVDAARSGEEDGREEAQGARAEGDQAEASLESPGSAVERAAAEAATSPENDRPEPTEAQKEAGNYAMGHLSIGGLDISIENPAGTRRRPEWPPLAHTYGYFKGTEARDGDHVDVFLGPHAEDDTNPVYVIDQKNADGSYDEPKVMMGFAGPEEAKAGYLANYEKGWDGFGGMRKMSFEQFKRWAKDPEQTKRPVSVAMTKAGKAIPAKLLNPEETSNASQEIDQQGRVQPKRENGNRGGQAAEAGGGDRLQRAAASRKEAVRAEEVSPRGAAAQARAKTKAQKAWDERIARLADYFAPGNVVRSYGGGFDRVISFNPDEKTPADWSVTVEHVRRGKDGWIGDGEPRTHRTEPSGATLTAGPIDRPAAKPAEDENQPRSVTAIEAKRQAIADLKALADKAETEGRFLPPEPWREAMIDAMGKNGFGRSATGSPDFVKGWKEGLENQPVPLSASNQRRRGQQEGLAWASQNGWRKSTPERTVNFSLPRAFGNATRTHMKISDDAKTLREVAKRVAALSPHLFSNLAHDADRPSSRGIDAARARIQGALELGDISPEQAKFTSWLLDQNPTIAEHMRINIVPGQDEARGRYDPVRSTVTLLTGGGESPDTAVHEIMHHSERLMPPEVQDGILAAHNTAWRDAVAKARAEAKAGDENAGQRLKALEAMPAATRGDKVAWRRVMGAFIDGTLKHEQDYALINPSEFWAMNATRILARRMEVAGSWIGRAKQWLGEFVQHARDTLGVPSDSPVLRGLRAVLNGRGKRLAPEMLRERLRNAGTGGYRNAPDSGEEERPSEEADAINDAQRQEAAPDKTEDLNQDTQGGTFAAEFITEMAAYDRMFAYPKAKGTTPEAALRELDPRIKYEGDATSPEEEKESGAERKLLFKSAKGDDFYVFQKGDDVWIDVSRLGEGDAGSLIYAAISDYAHNTGRRFIGDPAGLSDIAVRRRTEAMLSSALKHGTTEHLAPHERQVEGVSELGIPPLGWKEGDHLGNIQNLIETSVANLAAKVPEFQRARYDFKARAFRTGEGKPLHDEALDRWLSSVFRDREAGAGRRTLKRGILLNTLLRAEGGERPGLLARSLREPDQHLTPLRGLLYDVRGAGGEARGQVPGLALDRSTEPRDRVQTLTRLRGLWEKLSHGKISGEDYIRETGRLTEQLNRVRRVQQGDRAARETERGPDWVRERLLRARRQGDIAPETAEFGLWLLNENPHLANDLAISVRKGVRGTSGQYSPIERTMALFKDRSAATDTAVHEIMHHTERMMPVEVQHGILDAYNKAFTRALDDARKATDPAKPETQARADALVDMRMASLGDGDAWSRVLKAFVSGALNHDSDYQLMNPSEFWAMNATKILSRRMETEGRWAATAKRWLSELVQKARAIFGLPNDAAVLRGLRSVINGRGTFDAKKMLAWLHEDTPQARLFNLDGASADDAGKLRSVADALKSIQDGKDETVIRNLRPDLAQFGGSPDVHITVGNLKRGLAHILAKRTDAVLARVLAAVAIGRDVSFQAAKKTVRISHDGVTAVLSLDEHGRQKTWLLTGWEDGRPDAKGEVGAQSPATQSAPIFSRDALGASLRHIISAADALDQGSRYSISPDATEGSAAAQGPGGSHIPPNFKSGDSASGPRPILDIGSIKATVKEALTSGPLGEAAGTLLKSGAVRIEREAPRGAPVGADAWTDKSGTVHILESVPPAVAQAKLLHEMFHAGVRPLIGSEAWNGLQQQLGLLYRRARMGDTGLSRFYGEALDRLRTAARQGDENAADNPLTPQEFAAYAIEQYERAPAGVRKWLDGAIGAVKAWALKRWGKQLGEITPAQLRQLAAGALEAGAATERALAYANMTDRNLYSASERDEALNNARSALQDGGAATLRDFVGNAQRDIGRLANYLAHPRHIAALYRPFAPVFQAVMDRMARRDRIITELNHTYEPYARATTKAKEAVNKALELGRHLSTTWSEEELTKGVTNPGWRWAFRDGPDGKKVRYKRELQGALTKAGDTIKLTPDEAKIYTGVRRMMDQALDMMRDQMLTDMGYEKYAGNMKALRDAVADVRDSGVLNSDLEHAGQLAADFEQAKRTGYVPFSRFGDFVVAVKRDKAPIDFVRDPRDGSMWILRNQPPEMNDFLNTIGAHYDHLEGGWTLNDAQRQAVQEHNTETLYAEKIETGLRDLGREQLAKWRERPVLEIPSVKAAHERISAEWAKDPSARVVAFQARGRIPENRVKLSDIDALADVAQIDPATWDVIREKFQDAIQGMSFRKHFFNADNVPGYSQDFERAITDYMAGTAGYLARRQFQERIDGALKGVTTPKLFQYANDYVRYTDLPQEELGTLRQLGYFTYIAGNVKSGLVNLTQQALMSFPILSQVANPLRVTKELARANLDALRMMTASWDIGLNMFDPAKAPADVREDLRMAWEAGEFIPTATFEIMATSQQRNIGVRGIKRTFNRATQAVGLTFSVPERINRIATYIAAHRLAQDPATKARAEQVYGSNALAGLNMLGDHFSPAHFADYMVDESQFRMGKANRPRVMRGPGAALLQFKGFMMQTLESYWRMATAQGRAGKFAAAASLATMVGLSGFWGFPGADDMRKLAEGFLRFILDRDVDLRTGLRAAVLNMTGSQWLAAATDRGAPFASGWDVGSVGMGNIAPQSGSITDLAGIPWDMLITRPGAAAAQLRNGNPMGALMAVAPKFIGNLGQAWQMAHGGFRDSRGRIVLSRDDLSNLDIAQKMIGFTPTDITNVRDARYAVSRMQSATDAAKSQYIQRIATTLAAIRRATDPGTKQDLRQQYRATLKDIQAFNRTVPPAQRIQVTASTIRNAMRQEVGGLPALFGHERKQARGAAANIRQVFGIKGLGP